MALVYTKFGENYQAINAATEALNIDSNNEKAYFRRGDARIATKDYEQGHGLSFDSGSILTCHITLT